jgi:hypothetical protein
VIDQKFQSLGVLERLKHFQLPRVPLMQILIARVYLGIDYRLPHRPTTVSIDGLEHLDGDRPMMVAMNHTD